MKLVETLSKHKNSHYILFLAVLFALTLIVTYAYNPIKEYPGWDYHFHIMRLESLMNAFRDGTFPIYIDYDVEKGYGYLSKMFYPDPMLIPFAAIGLLTNSYIAYQTMLFTFTILCGLFTYNTINTIYKNTFAASVGAILYTFSLYRMYDMFHRGALSETICFTFLPLVILGLYHVIKGDKRKWYILTIGFSLIIFSHVITSVLVAFTVFIIALVYIKDLLQEPKRILYIVVAAIATLLLTSYFIYPVLEQMFSNTFYYENKMGATIWTTTIGPKKLLFGLTCGITYFSDPFFVGTGFILTLAVLTRFWVKGKSPQLKSVDIGVAIAVFYLFCCTYFFPWKSYPFWKLGFIQFGWRLYLFVSYFFAVAGAYYLSLLCKSSKSKLVVSSLIVILTIFTIYTHSRDYRYINRTYLNTYVDKPKLENSFYLFGCEYVPERVPSIKYIEERGSDSITTKYSDTQIINVKKQKGITSFDVKTTEKDSLELPLFFYKGYKATLNHKEDLPISQSQHGLVEIPVHQSGRVEVYYAGTAVQRVSSYITLASILCLCIYIFSVKRRDE